MNRRAVAAACLVASPVLHLVSYFLWPAGTEGSDAVQVATAAAHPGAMTAAALVEALGWVLLLPALAVLWNEVRGRGSVLVTIGVWGSVLGVLGFVSSSVLNLVTVALAGTPSGLASLTAMKESGTIALVVVLPILLGLVALVVLLAGLARAGLAGWWLPVAGAVSVVLDQVTSESGNALVLSAAFLPMAVALGHRWGSGSPSRHRRARRTAPWRAPPPAVDWRIFPATPGRLHPASRECRPRTVVARASTDDGRHDHGDDTVQRGGTAGLVGGALWALLPGWCSWCISRTPRAARWRSSPSPRPHWVVGALSLVLLLVALSRLRAGLADGGGRLGRVGVVVSGRRAAGDGGGQRHRAGDDHLQRHRERPRALGFLIGFLVLVVGSLLLGIALPRGRREPLVRWAAPCWSASPCRSGSASASSAQRHRPARPTSGSGPRSPFPTGIAWVLLGRSLSASGRAADAGVRRRPDHPIHGGPRRPARPSVDAGRPSAHRAQARGTREPR